ncbi:MAG: hypothetical protein JST79_21810 [Acidobacteria bacterium]|nr:hypothetical protein [Acidobacteriota bacterium]
MTSIANILREEDIEGFIQLGAPSDEYNSEASKIATAICRLGNDFSEAQVAKVLEEVWKDSFGLLSTEDIEARRTAFQCVARRIMFEAKQLDGKQGLRAREGMMYFQKGDRISFIPSDPWDFVTVNGSGPFLGTVAAMNEANHREMFVKLDKHLQYAGIEADYFYVSNRFVGQKFIISHQDIPCDFCSMLESEIGSLVAEPSPLAGRLFSLGSISWISAPE